jgi:REP element-mobilizing transposase RayT
LYWFKSITTHDYRLGVESGVFAPFEKRLWQRSYHDHIIRDESDLNRIRKYIRENPIQWDEDDLR